MPTRGYGNRQNRKGHSETGHAAARPVEGPGGQQDADQEEDGPLDTQLPPAGIPAEAVIIGVVVVVQGGSPPQQDVDQAT